MKKVFAFTLFFSLLGLLPLGTVGSSLCQAQVNPWPWSKPLPFPWDNIEGTWTENSSQFTFSFQVIENSWGDRHIKIKQRDAITNEVIGQGVGFENSDRIVVAGMTGGPLKEFTLTIRSLENVYGWDSRKMTGVTIESYENELLYHFEIYKIDETPLTLPASQSYNRPRCHNIF